MIYISNNSTGEIVQRIDAPDECAKGYEREGYSVLVTDAVIDIRANYVSDEDFIPIPAKPSEFHTWDRLLHTWTQNRGLAEKSVRAKRDNLLNATVDKINAVRWAAMSESDRTAWDTYRTALLDVTEQTGFPFEVIWPLAPQQQ